MDGVLCDSLDCWEDWIMQKYNVTRSEAHSQYWADLKTRFGSDVLEFWSKGSNVYTNTKPFDYMIELLRELSYHNIKVVTSTFPQMEYQKVKWFVKHSILKDSDIICIPSNAHKSPYTKDGILIDDGFQNIIDHVSHNNCIGILYNHNGKYAHAGMFKSNCDGKRIRYCESYNQILLEIEKIQEGR
jgi:hypothetical protein